jgi:RNA polymerase sigma-70 factor (ECF subfamily)
MNSITVSNSAPIPINPPINGRIKELLIKAKRGDQGAFSELYNLYFDKIYRFIYYRVNHKELAEDLAEDVFVKVYQKIGSVNEDKVFEGWLYQVARNTVIDYYRSKKQTIAIEEVENILQYESTIVDILNLEAQQKIFLKLLKELSSEQQTVIKLKFLEDLDNPTIAGMLNKSEGAIRVIQHRAVSKLKELIDKLKLGK